MAWMKAAGKRTLWSRGGGGAAAAGKKGEVIKSPSMLLSYAVALSSMLVGASIVHNIVKPDLTIPALDHSEKDDASMKDSGDVSSSDD
ncbi:unnamed protein product [Sphagnum jensenii]|uniref:Uncharacterized protein n=1 Tax=Sphagnum jensenii TaxID=128206 RepID=A0ABP1A297_9BRYO